MPEFPLGQAFFARLDNSKKKIDKIVPKNMELEVIIVEESKGEWGVCESQYIDAVVCFGFLLCILCISLQLL